MNKLLASWLCICVFFGSPWCAAARPQHQAPVAQTHAATAAHAKVSPAVKAAAATVAAKPAPRTTAAEAKPAATPKTQLASKFSSFSAVDKAPPAQDDTWEPIDAKDLNHIDVSE